MRAARAAWVLCALYALVMAGCPQNIEGDSSDAGIEQHADGGDAGGPGDAGQGDAGHPDGGTDAHDDGGVDAGQSPLTWAKMSMPQTGGVVSLAGRARDDLFAGDTHGNLHHWNGVDWGIARATTTNTALLSLWMSEAGELFGAGAPGLLHCAAPCGRGGMFVHTSFSSISMLGVCGRTGVGVFAVGTRTITSKGTLLRWQPGTATWSEVATELSVLPQVSGCWVSSLGDVFIAGQSSILRFDGAAVTEEPVNFPAGFTQHQKATQYFHAVSGPRDGSFDPIFATGTGRAIVRRNAAGSWDFVRAAQGGSPNYALEHSPSGEALMGGPRESDGRALSVWNGETWQVPQVRPDLDIWTLHAPEADLWFAGGFENGVTGALWRGQR